MGGLLAKHDRYCQGRTHTIEDALLWGISAWICQTLPHTRQTENFITYTILGYTITLDKQEEC